MVPFLVRDHRYIKSFKKIVEANVVKVTLENYLLHRVIGCRVK